MSKAPRVGIQRHQGRPTSVRLRQTPVWGRGEQQQETLWQRQGAAQQQGALQPRPACQAYGGRTHYWEATLRQLLQRWEREVVPRNVLYGAEWRGMAVRDTEGVYGI